MRIIDIPELGTLCLTEKEWKMLVARFDISNARYDKNTGDMVIWRKCICLSYPLCKGCPCVFGDYACSSIIKSIIGHPFPTYYSYRQIRFGARDNGAVEDINKIHKWLLSIPRR